ncbi:MAG: ATP-binding cassette domain-containing protein, partial [Pleurocapsa sp. MO_226.B13]|nr:ATP-binding cassette domain-containing protein [Pleurocapsa sp. MO_226.B13]
LVDSGSISLGGINLKHFKLADLMANFAFVFQEVVLFEDTVLANIRLGKPKARGAEVIEAAKAARCHEFITAMPNGYQTNIGDRGAKLSGGQKQRIAIARAILKDAPIVILDEATAFIDSENEALIQEAISALVRDKTLIVIAHRLSTITEVDRIFVVNEGEITASGTHPELLDTSQLYRQMWTAHLAAQDWVFASQQPAYQTYLD